MKKNIILVIVPILLILVCIFNENILKIQTETKSFKTDEVFSALEVISNNTTISKNSTYESAVEDYIALLNEKVSMDKKEWFLKYKDLCVKYEKNLDPPETLEDYYVNEEIELFYRLVKKTSPDSSFESYILTANMILDELEEGESFSSCVSDNSVFDNVDNNISEDIKLACAYAFEIGF